MGQIIWYFHRAKSSVFFGYSVMLVLFLSSKSNISNDCVGKRTWIQKNFNLNVMS